LEASFNSAIYNLLIKEYLNAGLNLSISLNHVRKSSIIGVRCVQNKSKASEKISLAFLFLWVFDFQSDALSKNNPRALIPS
jgi:phosphate/sulfate permease